jgi:DinB family protein
VSGPPPPRRVPADPAGALEHVAKVTALLEATIARASTSFSDDERHQRVNDEWSTVESLQHCLFVIDVWLGRTIKGQEDPFHPIGMPPHFVPRKPPGSSVDPDAAPTFEEARDVLRGRLATLQDYCDALTPDEIARPIGGHAETVAGGLGVIFDELTFHNGFMNRDLDAIERSRA